MPTPREEIENILLDCYNGYEKMSAWETIFSDEVGLPFRTSLLGMPVEVIGFRVNDANTVQCEILHEGKARWISVEDLDEGRLPTDAQHLLTLYHNWLKGTY